MDLAAMIATKAQTKAAQAQAQKSVRNKALTEKSDLLIPVIKELNPSLEEFGLTAFLHADPSHLPCPAIHIKMASGRNAMGVYDQISEIFMLDDGSYAAGSCNRHVHNLTDKAALFEHIAESISSAVAAKRL